MKAPSPIGRTVSEAIKQRLTDPEYRAEFERLQPFEEIARQLIRIRMDHSLTQEALAERVGTTKSAISRLESGQHSPNVATLRKIAAAFGGNLVISFDVPKAPTPAKSRTLAH